VAEQNSGPERAGKPQVGEAAAEAIRLAREALASARAAAAQGGGRRGEPRQRLRRGAGGRRSDTRPQRSDPQPLSAAIDGLLEAEGWELAAATGSVFGRWAQIVGPELGAHTTPESLSEGELTVAADSTAWATQVRLLAPQLVRRLNSELGDGTVLRVRVRGPVTATRKPGEWRVRGGRGPRDTYG
jgi:predicted nucleic acid-binding Zn ribbon protein